MYRAGATASPIHLDADFLLGPEAAHLNISGVSGLATKTSAVEWLLSSIFAHFPEKKGKVAAVCFNVKGPDLCFLDQPATRLDDADRALYETLGVPAEPFRNVQYFAPYTARGYALNTLRSHDALAHNSLLQGAVLSGARRRPFAHNDVDKARDVWQRDEEIDQVYTGLFRELLTYMMEDPRNITACTHLLFMAKNIERAGDHVTNIAELVAFRSTGHGFVEARPKGGSGFYATEQVS